ncbi:MAG: metallopeptidase family protein [Planctomycetota bacterium]
MDFDAFSARARALAARQPEDVMEGIEAVEVLPEALPHPHVPGVYTLGTCEPSPLCEATGGEPLRSTLRLYHGSFAALAAEDPAFDVEAELLRTLVHEIRHHLEDRAGAPDLRREDALLEVHARFRAGQDVPAGWYRCGVAIEPGLWAVDLDLFLELELRRKEWEALPGHRLCLCILGERFEVDVPEDLDPDEIWTFEGEGLIEGEDEEAGDGPEGEEGDEPPAAGLAGDLHVVVLVP